MDSYRCFLQLFDFFNRTNSSSMIEYNVTFEYYMLWTSDLFWTRLMCISLFVLPLVPVSIAVLGHPSWYTLSIVDQISDQIQVQTMSWMPIIGARVSEQLLDQYPRPIIDTKNTVDDIESASESEGNDGHGGNTFFTSDCLSFGYQPSKSK